MQRHGRGPEQPYRITKKRLDESVMRILVAKAHLGLAAKKAGRYRQHLTTWVNSPESVAVAQQIADRSVTLVKNSSDFLPLKAPTSTAFFLLSESRTGVQGQAFLQEVHRRSPSSSMVIQLDSSMSGRAIFRQHWSALKAPSAI